MNIEKVLEETLKNYSNRNLLTENELKVVNNTHIGLSIIYAGRLIAEAIKELKDDIVNNEK